MFDLLDPTFVDDVKTKLAAADVEPYELELEITETSIMSDTGRVRDSLQRLHDLGVRIAIDDFGSGYSSLTYLMNLDVDTLKIDKSFVLAMSNSPQSISIVETIIDLAHVLDLRVVAEGVEEPTNLDALKQHGCDTAQGFLISRPVPPDELLRLARTEVKPQAFAIA
jgi:EAL domain-containing protein (putative c-di-GMP-specific phosphodiesterase class I)